MSKVIGIDLGTTNSAVAIWDDQKKQPKILENQEGMRTTPSIIAFTEDGQTLVGEPAKNQAVTNAKNTLYAVKRLIGRSFDDPEVQKMIKTAPFKIIPATPGNDKSDAWVEIRGEKKAPAEVSAEILMKLKKAAEERLGEEITRAVITVPAYFNDAQKKATKDAGTIAGLTVERIINEPTSAALAYGLDTNKDQTIIVYDLGGGTFDVSVLEVGGGLIEVKAANGDTFLGGEDFDRRIVDFLISEFKTQTGFDLSQADESKGYTDVMREQAMIRLKQAAENTKKQLSSSTMATVNEPYIAVVGGQPMNLTVNVTRAQLEDLVKDLIERSKEPCVQALKDAGISISEIDEVVMVGGMTRMPAVKEFVKGVFGKEPNCSVNPDEVVAGGASAQGAVLTGQLDDVVLLDVIPLSLSIRLANGTAEVVVPKQSSIPGTFKPEAFTTSVDGQENVRIRIGQGESPMFDNNKELGELVLKIPPAPAGQAQITVEFNIDENGTLAVTAKDQHGHEIKAEMKADGGLSEAEVEEMKRKAEASKEQDEQRKEAILATAEASSLVKQIDTVKAEDWYKNASEEARNTFNTVADNLKAAVDANENTKLPGLVKEFTDAKMGLTASLQQKAEDAAPAPNANDDNSDLTSEDQDREREEALKTAGKGNNTPKP